MVPGFFVIVGLGTFCSFIGGGRSLGPLPANPILNGTTLSSSPGDILASFSSRPTGSSTSTNFQFTNAPNSSLSAPASECSRIYGTGLEEDSCLDALASVPSDSHPVIFGKRTFAAAEVRLPYRILSGMYSSSSFSKAKDRIEKRHRYMFIAWIQRTASVPLTSISPRAVARTWPVGPIFSLLAMSCTQNVWNVLIALEGFIET